MTAPFTGEDLVKRGLFSSIIGLRINKTAATAKQQPAQSVHNPWQQPAFNEDQPCSTWRLREHDQQQQAIQANPPNVQQTRSLSQQLENTFLASPVEQPHLVTSPHDIFQEILCECAPMEQFQTANEMSQQQTFSSPDAWFSSNEFDFSLASNPPQQFVQHFSPPQQAHQTMPQNVRGDPLVCPHCFHAVNNLVPLSTIQHRLGNEQRDMANKGNQQILPHHPSFNSPTIGDCWQLEQLESPRLFPSATPIIDTNQSKPLDSTNQQLRNLLGGGPGSNMSFEELIKVVVSAVKDSGLLRGSAAPTSPATNPGSNESPEEILRRKRQQNNEAAARYRRRQKEAKMTKNEEIDLLTERNQELRNQISEIQTEMRRIRHLINNAKR